MDDARTALDEARALSPDAPEIAELERRLGSPSSPNAIFLAPDQADVDSDPEWPSKMDDARAALDEASTRSPDAPEMAEFERPLGSPSSPNPIFLAPDQADVDSDPGWPRGWPSKMDDVRAALDEAWTLSPDAPEIAELERRLGSPPSPNAILLAPDQADVDSDPEWPRMLAGVAVLLVLFSVLGFGLTQLYYGWADQLFSVAGFGRAANVVVHEQKTPTPSATEGTSSSKAERPAEEVANATENQNPPAITATTGSEQITPRPAAASRAATDRRVRSAEKSDQQRPTLESRRRQAFGSPSPTLGRPATPDAVETPASERARLVDEPAHTTASTAPDAVIPPVATAETSVVSIPTAALERSGESTHAESDRIRSVLVRYENAYNRLDAKAASSVWPKVDQAALRRAFDGLITQRVSLGLCEITVIGNIGGASCAGKAKWEPKIGGGLQTADRYWSFNLRKTDDGWKIEEARVR
jgi:hypothetical protein